MSDEHETFSDRTHPVARARTLLGRRGADLPEVALKALAREVILRIARKPVVLEEDRLTVSDVIIGAGRVYGILRELRTVFLAERLPHTPGAAAVFAQVPGEIHTIGVTMAADAMRRRGWEVDLRLGLNHDALVSEIARMQPAMVGLSASTLQQTFALARLIVALRVCCPQVWILVAGQIVQQDGHLRDLVDADAVAGTMDEAASALTAHLEELTRMSERRG